MIKFKYLLLSVLIAIILLLLILNESYSGDSKMSISVGSKKFTESVILGEMVARLIEAAGLGSTHRTQLGGTRILFQALVDGEIDVYTEYTGTITQEILAGKGISSKSDAKNYLDNLGIEMSEPLGFNNTYVIGMKEDRAEELNIKTISDLRRHPELKIGFSNEFMDRGDGWPSLQKKYKLPHANVRGVDHDIGYRGIESGSIDVIDLYVTDAEIEYYHLRSIQDDLNHFPEYHAVLLYRKDLSQKAPEAVKSLLNLVGAISAKDMVRLNSDVKMNGLTESKVAVGFLEEKFNIKLNSYEVTIGDKLIQYTYEHLYLVSISLVSAIIVSIPLGVIAYKRPKFGQFVLGMVGVIQTIPSLALIVFMIPLLGIGAKPAIAALFLYSMLPIVRNTYSGLKDIPQPLRESAEALGLPSNVRLRRIELPLASRSILAGIKTSAVINVGTATLGALIGAGGFGQPIMTGIRLDNTMLILQGAIPAALLAFSVQWLFDLLEPIFVSEGLRLKK